MREVCLACIGFILEMTIFFAAGRLLSKALKLKEDISLQLILGYLVYFTVLEVAVVPMTLLWVPLNRAAALWVVLFSFGTKQKKGCIRKTKEDSFGQTVCGGAL